MNVSAYCFLSPIVSLGELRLLSGSRGATTDFFIPPSPPGGHHAFKKFRVRDEDKMTQDI